MKMEAISKYKQSKMIKCIIFDCDGTLVDSEYLCKLALEQKLLEYGISENTADLIHRFLGVKLEEILSSLESKHKISFNTDIVESYRELVNNLFEEKLKACDGVESTLSRIHLPICVASSGPISKIKHALALTDLTKFFNNNIFSSYDIGSWKPEPDLFLHAAKQMGFLPCHCAVVEDSSVGIQAATAAGMIPILYDPGDTQNAFIGVRTINKWSDLLSIVT